MTRLLVTGSRGQIGRALVEAAQARGVATQGLGHGDGPTAVDVTDPGAVRRAIESARPTVIVHAAAWTDVDGCERDPQRAEATNVGGTANVVAAADAVGARVVLLSTDYVFDGAKEGAYVEGDEPSPINAYGRTKLAAEALVPADGTVVRTSWVSGRHGTNVARFVLAEGLAGRPMRFVDDQVGRPTIADGLAQALLDLVEDPLPGIVHLAHQGPVSWASFAQEVLDEAGLDPTLVTPIRTAELDPPRLARRPANSVLDDARLRASGRALLPHHRTALAPLVRALRTEVRPSR